MMAGTDLPVWLFFITVIPATILVAAAIGAIAVWRDGRGSR